MQIPKQQHDLRFYFIDVMSVEVRAGDDVHNYFAEEDGSAIETFDFDPLKLLQD